MIEISVDQKLLNKIHEALANMHGQGQNLMDDEGPLNALQNMVTVNKGASGNFDDYFG